MGLADPFARWAALQASSTDVSNRVGEHVDLAFWDRIADDYDAGALANRVPAVLERVQDRVPPGSSLLDVGAGTGAFAVPLAASHAANVTALDYSPAMLRVLERKLASPGAPSNVATLLARWEDAEVEAHDVVLAANVLYRAADLRRSMAKLVRTARRRGVIVWSVGRADRAQHRVRDAVSPGRYQPGPDYVHALDGLFALDVYANVEMVDTRESPHYDSDEAAARALLSWEPDPAELTRAVDCLPHVLERDGDGWTWRRRGHVAVIWWDANGAAP